MQPLCSWSMLQAVEKHLTYIYYFNINIYSDVCTYIWWWILGLSFWRCWQMTATAVASSARRARWSRRYVKIRILRSLCQSMSYHLRPISLVFFKKQLIKILSIKVMTKCLEGVPALFDVSEVNSYVICLWITLWAFDCNSSGIWLCSLVITSLSSGKVFPIEVL